MGETGETIRRIPDLEESETLHAVAMEIDSATQLIYPLLYEIANNCFAIATQKSGCCVIQSCVESAGGELRDCIIVEILTNAVQLLEDQYGNYVVQHLLGLKLPRVAYILIDRLQGNFLTLSCNKYASNVVEKIILNSREKHSTRTITELLSNPSGSMLLMDPYGNFVIQSSLQRAKRAGARDDKGNPIIRNYYSSPLTASGNTHDDMLLAKLETVNTGSVCFQHGSGTSCVVRVASF